MIVSQAVKRCPRCKQVKAIELFDWRNCKACNAELAEKRSHYHMRQSQQARRRHGRNPVQKQISAPRPSVAKPSMKDPDRLADMVRGTQVLGTARWGDDLAPIVAVTPGPIGEKYRWHPLYTLLNGIAVGAWVVIRLPSSDEAKKARLALQDAWLISYIEQAYQCHYKIKRRNMSNDLWVRKCNGLP